MTLRELPLRGAFLIDLAPHGDDRESFTETFSAAVFEEHGLACAITQSAVSANRLRATLRGLHYQAEPHGQARLVRCLTGAVYDVIVDLRPNSPTFRSWHAVELTAGEPRTLYVPRGFAHGFLTLVDGTELSYHLFGPYKPECERGIRWDDPAIRVTWPMPPAVLSPRDAAFADLEPVR